MRNGHKARALDRGPGPLRDPARWRQGEADVAGALGEQGVGGAEGAARAVVVAEISYYPEQEYEKEDHNRERNAGG